jgi:branched-chain amino acid transport system permease protein
MNQFLDMVLIGVSAASIYSLMAISMVLVWRSTRVVNFAQAGMALLSAYIGYELVARIGNFWIALPLAMILGAAFSAFIEFALMRTLHKHSSQGAIAAIAPIIATLGLLGLIRAIIGFIWGHADVQLEAPLSKVGFTFGETTIAVSPMSLFVLLFVITLMIIVSVIFQKTNIGLALRASAYAPEIAQLAGIRVSGIRTLGWAIAGAAGAAAGILQTVNGTGSLSPESLEFSLLLVFGFIAAVIGGLESMVGSVIGALVLGIGLTFILNYVGTSLVFIGGFSVLILVLLIKPDGIMAKGKARRA